MLKLTAKRSRRSVIEVPESPTPPAEEPKRKPDRFWRIFMIVTLSILALGVILVCVLWGALARYERGENEKEAEESRLAYESEQAWLNSEEYRELVRAEREKYEPVNQTRALLDELRAEGYGALIDEAAFERSPYESDRELAAHLALGCPPEELTVREYTHGEEDVIARTELLFGDAVLFEVDYAASAPENDDYIKWQRSAVRFYRTAEKTVTVTVPDAASVVINGVQLGEAEQTALESVPAFAPYAAYAAVPSFRTYTLTQMAFVPSVTVTLDGTVLNGTIDENDRISFAYPEIGEDALPQELRETVARIAELYQYYIAGDYSFDDIKEFIVPNTEAYRSLSQLDNRWYTTHDGISLEGLTISGITRYGESCMSCTVEYTEVLYRNSRERYRGDVKEHFDLVEKDGVWRLAALSLN